PPNSMASKIWTERCLYQARARGAAEGWLTSVTSSFATGVCMVGIYSSERVTSLNNSSTEKHRGIKRCHWEYSMMVSSDLRTASTPNRSTPAFVEGAADALFLSIV